MPTEITLEEVMQEVLDSRLSDVHTALPGRVERYDATKQVADVRPMVRAAAEAPDGSVVTRSFPVLVSVPVAFLSGGGFFLSLPLAVGDTGLLIFSELPFDRWRATGQESHPADVRRHHVTSAIFMPCVRPAAAALTEPNIATDAVFGKTGSAVIHLKPSGEVHLGAATASDFVALAALVKARLDAIQTKFDAHIHTTTATVGLAGPAVVSPPTSPIGALAAVAAAKVKAT